MSPFGLVGEMDVVVAVAEGPQSMTEKDGRRERGRRSRTRLLERAAALASEEGLEALSLARLAADVGMSKSGVAALYPDRLALQLAVVDHATEVFTEAVVLPARREAAGLARLEALIDAWVDYIRRGVFPGGCFVQHCLAEQAHRPGPVRDALTDVADRWVDLLTGQVQRAAENHAVVTDAPEQVAFEIEAMLAAGHRGYARGRVSALDQSATACRRLLASLVPGR